MNETVDQLVDDELERLADRIDGAVISLESAWRVYQLAEAHVGRLKVTRDNLLAYKNSNA